jgi:hypothetical protein
MTSTMKESVAIRQRPMMLCKWCGHPSGPGPACRVCGSPLDLRLQGLQAFSEDLFSHQRLFRPTQAEAPLGEEVQAPLASRPGEPDRSPGEVPVQSQAVAPVIAMEEATDSPSEAEADPGPLLVLESRRWWAASPEPAVRAALRRETARTLVTRIAAFVGSVWLLDFLVTHV